ncbi:MAG: SBBP repeat-containing protein [Chitinophagales bacterium]|nr:SBBP repeat-containing protein [Chitinophagales bacterium]MDW8393278.1 SBBP repeat-containing protein [Chitinophagales bacterium]
MHRLRCCFFAFIFWSGSTFAASLQNHIGFIENIGQICDAEGRLNEEVLYLYEAPGFRLHLRRNGWSYEWVQPTESSDVECQPARALQQRFRSCRVDVVVDGAVRQPAIVALQPASFPIHYFGSEGLAITHVRHFNQIIYYDILPGVDLEFMLLPGPRKALIKYSFRIHPGANANDLRLLYCSSAAALHAADDLYVRTAAGSVSESRPLCFAGESKEGFYGDFILNGNAVQFSIPSSYQNQPVLIDPVLSYSTYFGGDSLEYSEDLKLDHEGNIIVTGRTASAGGIATVGAYDQTYNGGAFDVFLFKFDAQFQMQWATYFGGNRVDYGWALAVDGAGRIYVGGESYSNGLATPGAQQSVVNGLESDGLLACFSSNGLLEWCRYYGGVNKDQILSIACDNLGRLIATGYTLSSDSMATPGAFMPVYGGKGDIFLAAFDTANGNIVWGTYYGADKDDRGHHVAVSPTNQIYLTGTALSKSGIATPGAHQSQGANLIDAFLARFSSNGYPVWGTYIAGAYEERGRDCIVDLEGNIVVTGFTQSDTGFATPGAWQPYHVFGIDSTGYYTLDAFLQKYDSNGVLLWGTYFGDTLSETVRGLTINSHNEILICGATFSAKGIAYGNAWQTHLGGVSDAWFAKFRPDGQLAFSSYFGGSGDEQVGGYGLNIETDALNRIYLCSSTTSDDSIATPNAYQTYRAGNYDIFLARLDDKCFDRYEPNDALSSAAPLQVTHSSDEHALYAAVASATDNDFFSFVLNQPQQQLLASLSALPADYDLFAYDETGTLIGQSQNSGLQEENLSIGLVVTGTYYLSVQPAGSTQWNDSLCYELRVHLDSLLFTAVAPTGKINFRAVPNPFTEQVWAECFLPEAAAVTLCLTDLLGTQVLCHRQELAAGQHRLMLASDTLPDGMYVLTFQTADYCFTQKVIRLAGRQ